MNRQMARRMQRRLSFSRADIEDLSKYVAENEKQNQQDMIIRFLGVCAEALRLEFGFGDKRLSQFGSRVNSLLDSINLGYVSFDDLLEDLSIKQHVVHKIKTQAKEKDNNNAKLIK